MQNEKVLIIGGSRGIGAEMVRRFSEAGSRVAFFYQTRHEAAKALAAQTGAEAVCVDGGWYTDNYQELVKIYIPIPRGSLRSGPNAIYNDDTLNETVPMFVKGAALRGKQRSPFLYPEMEAAIVDGRYACNARPLWHGGALGKTTEV